MIYRHNHFLLNITCRKTKDATEFGMDRNLSWEARMITVEEYRNPMDFDYLVKSVQMQKIW